MDQQVLRDIVEQASRAPSVHNTQPWRFVTRADAVEVWTDPSRGLPVLDPDGRSRHLSCGAALLQARLAAAGHGLRADVRLLPEPDEPTHLADVVLAEGGDDGAGAGDGAGGGADPGDRALAAAIADRHTDRAVFESRPVPADVVRALTRAAEQEGAWLRTAEDPADAAAITVLLARADQTLAGDQAYRDELRRWTGRDRVGDGIPAEAVPATPPDQRGSSYRLRDFVADRDPDGSPRDPDADPPPAEHPLVVVIGTRDDDVRAWVQAGQAMARVLLTATAAGVSASPMTQPLEITDTRARLAHELGVVGHPQMLLRLGYGSGGTATPRRPVDEILDPP